MKLQQDETFTSTVRRKQKKKKRHRPSVVQKPTTQVIGRPKVNNKGHPGHPNSINGHPTGHRGHRSSGDLSDTGHRGHRSSGDLSDIGHRGHRSSGDLSDIGRRGHPFWSSVDHLVRLTQTPTGTGTRTEQEGLKLDNASVVTVSSEENRRLTQLPI
mgnify:CR=1 FL=1